MQAERTAQEEIERLRRELEYMRAQPREVIKKKKKLIKILSLILEYFSKRSLFISHLHLLQIKSNQSLSL
jgi:hypothetical protein